MPALIAAGYRVITYNRRGFGQSSQPWSGYDYDTFAADLDGLMTHLHLEDATLVGFSMGGGEVARYIGTFGSERVSKAGLPGPFRLICTSPLTIPKAALTTPQSMALSRASPPTAWRSWTTSPQVFQRRRQADGECDSARIRPQHRRLRIAEGNAGLHPRVSHTDFRADLATVTLPTLVIHGDSDAIVALQVSGARTQKAIAGSQLCVVKGGPHGFNLSHAAEFNKGLLDFLGA